jgi:hypothetical protein
MISPGLHSIFSTLNVNFEGPDEPVLRYFVLSVDERFRKVTQTVSGCGVTAVIEAFARVPPVQQPTIAELVPLVMKNEFNGCQALIVGGSRGLGEVAAKLIGAGGGSVILTYAVGSSDGETVARLNGIAVMTHMFYFATPKIGGKNVTRIFRQAVFESYTEFYVNAFAKLCSAIESEGYPRVGILYPSSVFVDDAPAGFCEYAMAKAAGEKLCSYLEKNSKFYFSTPRYPKFLTDQTATVFPTSTEPIAETILRSIRSLMAADKPNAAA